MSFVLCKERIYICKVERVLGKWMGYKVDRREPVYVIRAGEDLCRVEENARKMMG